jgi:actin-like ATPase involved in cell morphogenesis
VVAQGDEKIRSSDHAGAIERYDSESSQLAQAYEQKVAYLNKAYADKLKSMTPKLKADIMESVKLR